MKWLFLLLPIFSFGQVKMNGYTSYPNSVTNIPDSVIYTASPHTKVAKRLPEFHGTPNLSKYYLHSGYDIGHEADADDMDYSAQSEFDSFNFINVFPQRPNLNRRTWLALESYVRSLNVPVRVKVSYSGVLGHLGIVTIPAVCIKDIWYNGKHEHYDMPNSDTVVRHGFTYYKK